MLLQRKRVTMCYSCSSYYGYFCWLTNRFFVVINIVRKLLINRWDASEVNFSHYYYLSDLFNKWMKELLKLVRWITIWTSSHPDKISKITFQQCQNLPVNLLRRRVGYNWEELWEYKWLDVTVHSGPIGRRSK